MKTKTIILLSVCALVVLFQGIGAGYAYHSLKEKAGVALKAAFRKAFDTLVDEQVNALPYPDGTVTHLIYTPAARRLRTTGDVARLPAPAVGKRVAL